MVLRGKVRRMAFLELRNISKSYGKNRVLDKVMLTAEKSEFLVILGASGEGKSTILNIISGVIRPDEGEVVIDGQVVDDSNKTYVPPELRDIGYVFQNYALYPHMSAFDNIAFPLKMRKLPEEEIKKRVREVAEMLRISHVLDHKPSQLSGGQQQRVAVARAIVKQPKLLLMDEPFSNIDPALRASVRWEIKTLVKQVGITTVMATHDQEEAMSLADKILILHKGKIIQTGTPEEIYNRPVNTYVADFVGGMNILPANILIPQIESIAELKSLSVENIGYIGFRAEHTRLDDEGIKGRVIGSEYRGDKWVVLADIGSDKPVKLYLTTKVNVDDTIRFLPSRIYFFDSQGSLVDTKTLA